MTSHYADLKRKLHQLDIDYGYLASVLNRSRQTVKYAMTGRVKLGINQCWTIFNLLGEDESRFPQYFPYQGRVRQ